MIKFILYYNFIIKAGTNYTIWASIKKQDFKDLLKMSFISYENNFIYLFFFTYV